MIAYAQKYGTLIYIPYAHITLEIRKKLNALSMWKSSIDTGKCWYWEFPPRDSVDAKNYSKARRLLKHLGFEIKEYAETNHNEVWGW